MTDTNYVGSIVKILETPKQRVSKTNVPVTEFRAQLPQVRGIKIVSLIFWGNLAREVADYYKAGDYILVEGYVSVINKQKYKKVKITALKVYPFLLSYNRSINKH